MFQSLKEYIKLKSGLKQSSHELRGVEKSLTQKIDFLAAYMNLTWPARLEIDPVILKQAVDKVSREFGVKDFSPAIHKNDLMFAFHVNRYKYQLPEAVYSYFRVGASTAKNLQKLAANARVKPQKVLDFGSGYGRVSRFLPHYFPQAQVQITEVKEQAVEFQQREFGIKGIAHGQETSAFSDEKYDLILALSVFTHIPEKAFKAWMDKMLQCLNTGGALVFTFLDQHSGESQSILQNMNIDSGPFIYITRSEDKHFSFVSDSIKDEEEYGSSFVTRAYLKNLLQDRCKSLQFIDRELVKGQDAALVIK